MIKKVLTIDKIVAASIELFHKNSYANTTLQDISKASETSIGSIYHAFPEGKKDIANLIAKRYFGEYTEGLADMLSSDLVNTPLEQIIGNIINLLIDLGNKYPCFYDPIFEGTQIVFAKEATKLEAQLSNQIVLMIQIKIPTMSREKAELKLKICNKVWDTILEEYEKTQDKQLLEELKIITLQYLNN
jgi:AcrR family transcriptional regulator